MYKKVSETWSQIRLGEMTPREIAWGFAVGTFVALLPTFGFSVFLGVLLMGLFPHMNRPSVILALVVWNPLVQIPVYALSYELGGVLFSSLPVVEYKFEMLSQLFVFTRRFLVGHVLNTLFLSALSYLVVYLIVSKRTTATQ